MIPALLIVAIGGGVALVLIQRRRAADFKSLAVRIGFVYLGTALPKSLSVSANKIADFTAVWNAIDGDRNGTQVVAFDCRIGTGRARRNLTAIAAKNSVDKLGYFPSDFETHRAGDWVLIFPARSISFPSGFMPVAELGAYIESI
jgi:hypothetical protein